MAPSWSKSEIPVSAPSGSTRRFQILIAKLQLIERAICPDGPVEAFLSSKQSCRFLRFSFGTEVVFITIPS